MHVRGTKARGLPDFFCIAAARAGLLVIRSSRGAATAIVEDGADGFAVDPEDVSLLADRLNLLLARPWQSVAKGESGRRKIEGNYLDPAVRSLSTVSLTICKRCRSGGADRFEIWLATPSGQVAADGHPIIHSQFRPRFLPGEIIVVSVG